MKDAVGKQVIQGSVSYPNTQNKVDQSILLVQKKSMAKFPHSPILHYACRSLLTENNYGKNNAIAMGLCAVFVVSWWRNKGLHTLNCMHNEVWGCAEI